MLFIGYVIFAISLLLLFFDERIIGTIIVDESGDAEMMRIGVLSDTHISSPGESFKRDVARAFQGCQTILHAGDLTDISVLRAFCGKEVHAVCGNMCTQATRQILPEERCLVIEGYLFCICHGADGPRATIADRMFERFPEANCIIYGHTHKAICQRIGSTLLMNPGSFQATGRYGAPGTYGIITIDDQGLHGSIHELDTTTTRVTYRQA